MAKHLAEYLAVDPTSKTGLRWIRKPAKCINVGAEAFPTLDAGGYYNGRFDGKGVRAHRVVFYLTHGYWPAAVDHENGCVRIIKRATCVMGTNTLTTTT